MSKVGKFEELESWQQARELVKLVYQLSKNHKDFSRNYSLKDQLQRAAVSVMNNIAEGFERCNNKEFIYFLYIAKASAGEVRSLSYVLKDLEYINQNEFNTLQSLTILVSNKISGLINYLKTTNYRGTRYKKEG